MHVQKIQKALLPWWCDGIDGGAAPEPFAACC